MRYRLPRQNINSEINKVITREARKQSFTLSRASKLDLKEMVEVMRAIERSGLPKHLVCKKLSDKLGYGIFLHPDAAPLKKGQVIAPYAGEVSIVPQATFAESSYAFAPIEEMLLTREEQQRFSKKEKYHPKRHYSLRIDADKKGNFTRFINHSDKPNVIVYLLTIPPNPYNLEPARIEVVYTVKKTIQPGEQLLVNYEADGEKSYWGAVKIKPFSMNPQTFTLSPSLKVVKSHS
ncbi:MAG: SET domain-containing protein [Chlamydiales bacterium]|nr:SET domain-containing protein [Chlamydiales bacterium]